MEGYRFTRTRALRIAGSGVAGRGVVASVIAGASLVAGCAMHLGGGSPSTPAPSAAAARDADTGQLATLRAIGGSALSGKVRVIDRGDGAAVFLSLTNLPSGAYRIAFHETPNCSSPNGFSAGPVWAPASTARQPQAFVPTQYSNTEAIVEYELRLAGLRATGANGVAGRSVVLYAGRVVTPIVPDVPNAAIACGVFEPTRTLF